MNPGIPVNGNTAADSPAAAADAGAIFAACCDNICIAANRDVSGTSKVWIILTGSADTGTAIAACRRDLAAINGNRSGVIATFIAADARSVAVLFVSSNQFAGVPALSIDVQRTAIADLDTARDGQGLAVHQDQIHRAADGHAAVEGQILGCNDPAAPTGIGRANITIVIAVLAVAVFIHISYRFLCSVLESHADRSVLAGHGEGINAAIPARQCLRSGRAVGIANAVHSLSRYGLHSDGNLFARCRHSRTDDNISIRIVISSCDAVNAFPQLPNRFCRGRLTEGICGPCIVSGSVDFPLVKLITVRRRKCAIRQNGRRVLPYRLTVHDAAAAVLVKEQRAVQYNTDGIRGTGNGDLILCSACRHPEPAGAEGFGQGDGSRCDGHSLTFGDGCRCDVTRDFQRCQDRGQRNFFSAGYAAC